MNQIFQPRAKGLFRASAVNIENVRTTQIAHIFSKVNCYLIRSTIEFSRNEKKWRDRRIFSSLFFGNSSPEHFFGEIIEQFRKKLTVQVELCHSLMTMTSRGTNLSRSSSQSTPVRKCTDGHIHSARYRISLCSDTGRDCTLQVRGTWAFQA